MLGCIEKCTTELKLFINSKTTNQSTKFKPHWFPHTGNNKDLCTQCL